MGFSFKTTFPLQVEQTRGLAFALLVRKLLKERMENLKSESIRIIHKRLSTRRFQLESFNPKKRQDRKSKRGEHKKDYEVQIKNKHTRLFNGRLISQQAAAFLLIIINELRFFAAFWKRAGQLGICSLGPHSAAAALWGSFHLQKRLADCLLLATRIRPFLVNVKPNTLKTLRSPWWDGQIGLVENDFHPASAGERRKDSNCKKQYW